VVLWTIVLLTLPQLLSWIAAQGINIPSGSGSVGTSWLASVETVFKNFVNQIVVAKLVPVIAAYFVLKATLDGAAGENPLGSIVAALFLMSLSATMQLMQGWNSGGEYAMTDMLTSLWNYIAGQICRPRRDWPVSEQSSTLSGTDPGPGWSSPRSLF